MSVTIPLITLGTFMWLLIGVTLGYITERLYYCVNNYKRGIERRRHNKPKVKDLMIYLFLGPLSIFLLLQAVILYIPAVREFFEKEIV